MAGYRIAENFREFCSFLAIRKSDLRKFGAWRPLAWQKQGIHESFPRENRIVTYSRKFSPSKIYRYMYIHCTCMCAAYGEYVGGLTTCVHVLQNSSVSSCFATCSEHRYHEYFQKRTETIARKRRQAMMQERMREGSTCGRGLR